MGPSGEINRLKRRSASVPLVVVSAAMPGLHALAGTAGASVAVGAMGADEDVDIAVGDGVTVTGIDVGDEDVGTAVADEA